MKNVLFKLNCLAFMIGMLIPFVSKATHNVGGEITYTYTGVPNTYLITYKFYRDCSGSTAPTSIDLCYSSASCSNSGTIDLFPIPGTGQQIPPSICVPVPAGGTTCNGGTGYGIQEYIYQATLVLPLQCTDWKFSYELCCRNTITTLLNSQGFGLYLEATLDNLTNPTNSSPYFTTIPVTQFCQNNQFYFDQGAFDIDNDSLVYSLINAQDANGGCPWTPFDLSYTTDPNGVPYSGINPIATLNGTTINPLTGVISFIPTTIQNAVIAVRCTEWDRNTVTVKSTIKREIQINIVNTCVISTPGYDSTLAATGINIVVDGVSNVACDDSVFFLVLNPPVQCGSIVPSDLRFYYMGPTGLVSNPVAAATGWDCVNGLTDSIRVTLINPISLGTSYIVSRVGFDGNSFLSECGSPMNEFDTLQITLVDSSIYNFSINDTADCAFDSLYIQCNQSISCQQIATNGSDFVLTDANGDTIPITSATCLGLQPGGLFNTQFVLGVQSSISAVSPLTLVVRNGSDLNTFSNACGNLILQNDTIGHIYLRNNITVNLGSDINACSSSPTPQLFAGYFPSAVTYTWTFNGNPTASDTATIAADSSGTYIVTAVASAACQGADTIDVNILQAPTINLGADVELCQGGTFTQLDAGAVTGGSYQWYLNNVALTNDTLQTYTPVAGGTYTVNVNVGASTCAGIDTVNVIVNSNPVITLPLDQTLCDNQTLPTLDAGAFANGTYQWTVNGVADPADSLQTIAVGAVGTYSVLVTSASGCTGTDNYELLGLIPTPVASLGSDQTACSNTPVTFNAGTSGATFQWYENGSLITAATDSFYTFTPATSGAFTYIVVVDNGNSCTSTDTINLNVVAQLNVAVNDLSFCSGTSTQLISSIVSGANYSWYLNDTTNVIPGQSSNILPISQGGTYYVLVTSGSCEARDSAVVTSIEQPTPSLSNITQCDNYPVLNSLYSGDGSTTYAWTFGGSPTGAGTSTLVTDPAAGGNGNGNYDVTVTNTLNGVSCTANAAMTLTVNTTPTNVVVSGDSTICTSAPGSSTVTLTVASTGGTSIQWLNGGFTIPGATGATYAATASGTYTAEVTGTGNCKTSDNGTVVIGVKPTAIIQDSLDANKKQDSVLFCAGQGVPLLSLVNPESGLSYSWSFDGTTGTDAVFEVNAIGTYSVVITDVEGCTSKDEIEVVDGACEVELYNVITPNGDGKNDLFVIDGLIEYPTRKLTVYNRWGNEVYSAGQYNNDWNGGDLAAGTYFYVLELNNTIKSSTKNGFLQIIK